jgi:hypothetical protein
MDLERARDLAAQLVTALAPDPPSPPAAVPIATADALDRALSLAGPGDVLTLDDTLVYRAPLRLGNGVTLLAAGAIGAGGRMTRDYPAPHVLGGLALGDGVRVYGLEVQAVGTPGATIVTIAGGEVWIDRLRVLGDPLTGTKRGIAANGNGAVAIVRSYVADCFGPYPGDDTQAICAWDMAPGLLIEDCDLSGGSETILIGGADSSTEARSPRGITIRKNTITKNPAWQAQLVNVKNTLELKSARDVTIVDNDITYSWGGHGQDGYGLMLTVRNQNGGNPWATIQDVLVAGNRFAHSAGAINILGRDDIKETGSGRAVPIGVVRPSLPMARVLILENTFDDLNPATYTGSKKMILLNGGPADLTIRGNRFTGVGMSSVVYFAGGPTCERLLIDGNTWPKTAYGVFGSNAAVGQAWDQYVASGTLGPNTEG